jgi:hypothetical protein
MCIYNWRVYYKVTLKPIATTKKGILLLQVLNEHQSQLLIHLHWLSQNNIQLYLRDKVECSRFILAQSVKNNKTLTILEGY